MTLADELEVMLARRNMLRRLAFIHDGGFKLPFNGELSPDELRMAQQATFDGPASWEEA